MGLLAFLLACSVLRAALLLAGAVPRGERCGLDRLPRDGRGQIESNGRAERLGLRSFRAVERLRPG